MAKSEMSLDIKVKSVKGETLGWLQLTSGGLINLLYSFY